MSAAQPDRAAALPRAVIFDNDGLLLDTETVWTRAESALFEHRGREFTLAIKQELVGTPADVNGQIIAGHLDEIGREAELIAELDAIVFEELGNGVELMAGARELLLELRELEVPVGLVSNSPPHFIALALELAELVDHFDAVVSGHELERPKPAPDPYLAACELLGVSPRRDVFVLEDSPTGVAAGVAAGLTVIGVPSLDGIVLEDAHEVVTSLGAPSLRAHLGLE